MAWRNSARRIESKGTTVAKVTSRGDLHRRRNETQSQYFTPEWVAKGIWQVLTPIIDSLKTEGMASFTVFDNAIGSGRLLAGAPVGDLALYGLDTDTRCIDALCQDAAEAKLDYQFEHGKMEDLFASGFHFAVINPPFSIHLESPNLTPYSCNSFGRFGQSTSAISHEYALEQALDAAVITAAVLPVSMDGYCRGKKELKAVVHLPRNTFTAEGANVSTAVYFFMPGKTEQVLVADLSKSEGWPQLSVDNGFLMYKTHPRFRLAGVDQTMPVITLPVTGNPRVELHHHNRRIVVKYQCGLVQAKVANGLLGDIAVGTRLPKSMKYQGDGRFLLDVLLLQDNPEEQLEALAHRINNLGGEAWISPTLSGFYKKLINRHKRAITPMYRMVKSKGPNTMQIMAKRRTLLEPGNFNSPSIGKGSILNALPSGGEYIVEVDSQTVTLRRDQLIERFEIIGDSDIAANDGEWTLKYPGLNHHFPAEAHQHRQRIRNAGIDWLAPFQEDSLTEGLVAPYGYIAGWQQGSGKARYALALALMHDGNNMIAVESGLIPEMLIEIEKLGISKSLWKVLRHGDSPTAKINLVSYATLRQGTRIIHTRTIKTGLNERVETRAKIVRTNAYRWRRQISTLLCDEGGLLANLNTQQTRAIKVLSARKLVILDGTPLRNNSSDLLPLSVVSAGNGVAHQPYGVKGKGLIEQRLLVTSNDSQRGEDAFFDNHVVTRWVTNEFRDEMQGGGKRVVPRIANLGLFRSWLAPNIQRRLRSEPELELFNNCPKPIRNVLKVEWEIPHLAFYLRTASEFSNWYKRSRGGGDKALNMVTVLARIGAVQRAANSPHVERKSAMGTYMPLTSKQKLAIERIKHWVAKDRKIILFAESPDVLKRLHTELEKENIASVLFSGKQNILQRTQEMSTEFRDGLAPVLLSSWVGQRGINVPQAGVVIFYEREWSTAEEQGIARTQRPDQLQTVVVEYLHLAGSIDEYMAQVVEWKRRSADAGLDYGDQAGEDEEFIHLDTVLHRFCEETLNMSVHEAKEYLAA